MGTVVVIDNVSLDGVIQDPAGDEGFRVGGWVGLLMDRPQLNQLALDEALASEALLLGRRSYVVRRGVAISEWRHGGQVDTEQAEGGDGAPGQDPPMSPDGQQPPVAADLRRSSPRWCSQRLEARL